jgi:hypothetical protein
MGMSKIAPLKLTRPFLGIGFSLTFSHPGCVLSVLEKGQERYCLNIPTLSYSSPMDILSFLSPLQSQTSTCFDGSLFSLLICLPGVLCGPLLSLRAVLFVDPFEEALKQLSLRQSWLGIGRRLKEYAQQCCGGGRNLTRYDQPSRK